MNWKRVLLSVGLPLIGALTALYIFAQYDADFLWFQNLGFAGVFTTILWAKLLIFAAFFFIFAVMGGVNVFIARKVGAKSRFAEPANFKSPAAVFDSIVHDKFVLCIWASLLLFITVLWTKLLIVTSIILIFAVMGGGYIYFAKKNQAKVQSNETNAVEGPDSSANILLFEKYLLYGWVLLLLLLSGFMGMRASNAWLTFLKFMHQSQFSVADPIFLKNAGFYVYSLPLYYVLEHWCFMALLLIIGTVGFSYYFDQAIGVRKKRIRINFGAKIHLSVLWGLAALIAAWSYRLNIYSLIHSNRGVVHGAGYTDIHAQLPAYWLLLILCLCMALIFFVLPLLKKLRWVAYFIGLFCGVLIVFSWIYPSVMERYVVKPDELSKETPYIKNNIRFTRLGFNLDKVRERLFPVKETMLYSDIKNNESTIHNIRLWDHRPLFQTYKQLQEIRLYYNFSKVDMDRYRLEDKYTEVAISSRGLSVGKLPGGAATWVNTHLVYTHGYGVVMSPVNEFTSDGMPKFTVKDIPPQSNSSIAITQPEIYYGEAGSGFAIVHTTNKEFDFPKGGRNVYTTYRGSGGVPLSSLFRRLIFSLKLSDLNILLSGSITDQSRIMFNRAVQKRDRIIAPFLSYDSDPYIVVGADGHLYWIHDAYTTTNMFPYSQPLSGKQDPNRSNYIRNSVKVVIDAYNGDVSYYLIDPSDPLAQTYKKMFPTLFTPAKEMPAFLKAHLRYPKDMFIKQIQMFTAYHMTDPQVFYNQEDLWSLPQQNYSGKKQAMLPYYIIMKLPDSKTEEFILMLPMTPSNKDNMIAWICARCDGDNYGQLLTYNLPKGKLIYGPRQIEARINQQPSITSEMTLWGQFGSRVIRGNLLTIPIANSFMYIEPVYLQSKEGEIPQLKRVIAIQNGELKMEKNLDAALKAGFAEEEVSQVKSQKAFSGPNSGPTPAMAMKALNHYHKAQEYLNQANWSKYGNELDQIQRILQAMTTGNKP
jgi:uncharacterized membrane protein (UPF0182 family)